MSTPALASPAAVLAALNANSSSAAAKSLFAGPSALNSNLLAAAAADGRRPDPVGPAPALAPLAPGVVPAAPAARAAVVPAGRDRQSILVQQWLDVMTVGLRDSRTDIRRRSDHAFYAALSLGILAALSVIAGASLALAGVVAVGIASSAGGVVSGLGSGMSYKMYLRENTNLLATIADLRAMENARFGLLASDYISDPATRDAVIRDLVERLSSKDRTQGAAA